MNKLQLVLITFVLIGAGFLRFYNLGYSEYIPDETTVMGPLKDTGIYTASSLLTQRKGPAQFLLAEVVYLFGYDVHNEFAYRVPFALASVLSLLFFFLAIKAFTGNYTVALVATAFLSVNGFLVAFGRVVQYQSLNMLFSFLGLYLYLLGFNSNKTKYTYLFCIFGLLSLFISLASHWDAIFITPLFIYVFVKAIARFLKAHNTKSLIYFVGIHIVVALIVFLPFLLIYLTEYQKITTHQEYFSGRIGSSVLNISMLNKKIQEYLFRDTLYNGFYYLMCLGTFSLLGLIFIKKNFSVVLWFFAILLCFILFVKKPGTHIYNMYIPLSVLAGYGFYALSYVFKKYLMILPCTLLCLGLLYFGYQNYLFYLDSKIEYPWARETIFENRTRNFNSNELANNLLGFPLYRGWEYVNDIVNKDITHTTKSQRYTFITNEVTSISEFYMDIPFGYSDTMYAIGIKKPFSNVKDYSFPQFHNRKTIYKLEQEGRMTARIYKILK